ncbi:cytoplasmic superoxide dismutase [Culex quinquefasciatus]|uniref:Cytoplasmic superoxide dismutase n=1 Tax=Culex quinquefasciatus TaxID=7176 RepID=B0WX83_CULQU|nr:cytoplasmic superoxide dismutase [Culex quinquefasciatus]|eukprot:XP_001862005.1 cytoplasmic superoxide dismutase [Culex quinquefasciatus]
MGYRQGVFKKLPPGSHVFYTVSLWCGGHINHSIFRKNFSLDQSDPLAELKKAFERDLYGLKM